MIADVAEMTCVDCGADNAYDGWETLEDISLCCDCAGARSAARGVNRDWERDQW